MKFEFPWTSKAVPTSAKVVPIPTDVVVPSPTGPEVHLPVPPEEFIVAIPDVI